MATGKRENAGGTEDWGKAAGATEVKAEESGTPPGSTTEETEDWGKVPDSTEDNTEDWGEGETVDWPRAQPVES